MTPQSEPPAGRRQKGPEFARLLRVLMQRGPLADPTDNSITTLSSIVDRRRETVQRWLKCQRVPRETEIYERLASAYGVDIALVTQAARVSILRSKQIKSIRDPRFNEVQEAIAVYHRMTESADLSIRVLAGYEAALIDRLRDLSSEYGVPYAYLLRRALHISKWLDIRPPERLLDYITGGSPPPLFEGIPRNFKAKLKKVTVTVTKRDRRSVWRHGAHGKEST